MCTLLKCAPTFCPSSTGGQLAVVIRAAVKLCAQVCEGLFAVLSVLLRGGIAGIRGDSTFNFIF